MITWKAYWNTNSCAPSPDCLTQQCCGGAWGFPLSTRFQWRDAPCPGPRLWEALPKPPKCQHSALTHGWLSVSFDRWPCEWVKEKWKNGNSYLSSRIWCKYFSLKLPLTLQGRFNLLFLFSQACHSQLSARWSSEHLFSLRKTRPGPKQSGEHVRPQKHKPSEVEGIGDTWKLYRSLVLSGTISTGMCQSGRVLLTAHGDSAAGQ